MAHCLTPLILCSQVTFSERSHLYPHCLCPHHPLPCFVFFGSSDTICHTAFSLEGKLSEGRGLPVSFTVSFLVLCMEWTFKHNLFKELVVHGHPLENPILGSQPFSWSTSTSLLLWDPSPTPDHPGSPVTVLPGPSGIGLIIDRIDHDHTSPLCLWFPRCPWPILNFSKLEFSCL